MSNLKILLFGRNGQLGWELHRALAPLGNIHAVDKEDLDLSDASALEHFLLEEKPNLVVNAAVYTDVDGAETNPKLAYALNEAAPGIMARACHKLSAGLIHYSTDYVFDGKATVPYKETDLPNPINTYGQSKLEGEKVVIQSEAAYLILRTSWVYSFRQPSFPLKVLEWARSRDQIRVVTDQVGSPTWARMLAQATSLALAMGRSDLLGWVQEVSGVYHLAGQGQASRFEFATRILQQRYEETGQHMPSVLPASSDDFPTPAHRPTYSALDCVFFGKRFGFQLPAWELALELAMAPIQA